MKLQFDQRMSPTIKDAWFKLYPWRPRMFWWRVACVVRVNRIRHKDYDKITTVCRLIDQKFPHYKQERKPRVIDHRIRDVSCYEYIL